MLVRGLEGLMSRPRAADDFKTIRTHMEELQREKLPGQPTPATDTSVIVVLAPVGGACSPTSATDRARHFSLAQPEGFLIGAARSHVVDWCHRSILTVVVLCSGPTWG